MEIIDLSMSIRNGEHYNVNTSIIPLVQHGDVRDRFDPPCEGFAANLMVMSDHNGTHIDAQNHFIRGGESVDQIPAGRMISPAVVCDVSNAKGDEIDVEDVIDGLRRIEHDVQEGETILLKTYGPDTAGKGISRSAAEYLVSLRVGAVGTDNSGIDNTTNRSRPGHMTLLTANVVIVENLVNLAQVIDRRFLFIALPLSIQGGTGSPVRAVALYPYVDAPWLTLSDIDGTPVS